MLGTAFWIFVGFLIGGAMPQPKWAGALIARGKAMAEQWRPA